MLQLGKTVRKNSLTRSRGSAFSGEERAFKALQRSIQITAEYSFACSPGNTARNFDYEAFIANVRANLPAVRSIENDRRFFLANGGSFSFESFYEIDRNLLESSTAECSSPMAALESHLAMRRIAERSVAENHPDGGIRLLQGNHDGQGHCYGQHESYEVDVAQGFLLLLWRIGLLVLLPYLVTYRFVAGIWMLMILMLSRLEHWRVSWKPQRLKSQETEHENPILVINSRPIPAKWILRCARGLRWMHAPLVLLLRYNIQLFALRHYRRLLTPFFASRCIIDGSGFVDSQGRYGISLRGSQLNEIVGFGAYGGSKPIFCCDRWLKGLCLGPPLHLTGYWKLFRKRQRIDISVGDSGVCPLSLYLRLGATSLVLDMADFQTKLSKPIPSLKDITAACNRFAMDWMLLAKEPGRQRRPWSATDLQKFYLLETRRFLEASPGKVSNEAWKILEIWQTTLNQLSGSDERGEPSEDLVGRIDWITKLWLLNQLDQNANRKTKRKLDLLYHELSREGYGTRVLEMQKEKSFVSENAILRAMGNPPRDSIAVARSYIIREFGDLETQLELDWDRARWRFEGKKHSVRFEVS